MKLDLGLSLILSLKHASVTWGPIFKTYFGLGILEYLKSNIMALGLILW